MKRLILALEEEILEVDKAIDAVNNQNSTDPYDIARVKTFKEELKELQEQESSTSDIDDSSATSGDTESESAENNLNTDITEDIPPTENSVEEDSDNDDDPPEDKGDKDKENQKEKPNQDDEVNTAEIDENTEKATESLEHLSYALEVMDEVTLCIKKGSARGLDALEHSNNFKLLSKIYGTGKSSSMALESINEPLGYVAEQKQLKVALEGIIEFIKAIIDKIVTFIQGIIKWIKNYYLYDPVKSEREHQQWKARRTQMQEYARKVRDMAAFEERAINAIGKKLYRERANTLVTGNTDNTFEQASGKLLETFDILQKYWDYNSKYLKTIIRPVFSDVFDYNETKSLQDNAKLLDINAEHYSPIPLEMSNEYRSFSKKQLPSDFNVYVSRSTLSGNKVFIFTMPAKTVTEIIEKSQNGQAFQGTLSSSVDQDGTRKGISYATNFNVLLRLIDGIERMQSVRKNLSYTTMNMVQMLEKLSNQLIRDASKMSDNTAEVSTKIATRAFVAKVRYNLNVFNNVINTPMTESVLYYKRLSSAVQDLADSNSTILQSVQQDIADKRESLGINT